MSVPLQNEREYCRPVLSSTLWEMSGTLGYVGLGIVMLVCLLLLAVNNDGIRKKVHDSVPEPLARFFAEPAAAAPLKPPMLGKAGRALREIAPQPVGSAAFGLGSTKGDVRRAQGEPTETTATVWAYGRSRVYFTNGRVSGWNEASENPLRLRR